MDYYSIAEPSLRRRRKADFNHKQSKRDKRLPWKRDDSRLIQENKRQYDDDEWGDCYEDYDHECVCTCGGSAGLIAKGYCYCGGDRICDECIDIMDQFACICCPEYRTESTYNCFRCGDRVTDSHDSTHCCGDEDGVIDYDGLSFDHIAVDEENESEFFGHFECQCGKAECSNCHPQGERSIVTQCNSPSIASGSESSYDDCSESLTDDDNDVGCDELGGWCTCYKLTDPDDFCPNCFDRFQMHYWTFGSRELTQQLIYRQLQINQIRINSK